MGEAASETVKIHVKAEGDPQLVGYRFAKRSIVAFPIGPDAPKHENVFPDLSVDLATDQYGRARGVFFTQPSAEGSLLAAFVDLGKRPLLRVNVVPEGGYREIINPVEVAHAYVVKTHEGRTVALAVKSVARARDGTAASVIFEWVYLD